MEPSSSGEAGVMESLNDAAEAGVMQRLNDAVEAGNIDALYAVIREDAGLLKRIDEVPFVDTPLHIAASRGHTDFAMEMVTLMPSYARKLNPDGFSPMHLALHYENTNLVRFLIEHDKDLIRVKGRNGMTPLHYTASQENFVLLTKFLIAYPDCIQDVTSQGQTALHIALKENKTEAFKVLVGWLRRSTHKYAAYWEDRVLNQLDYRGNSVLHFAAHNDHQAWVVRLLLSCAQLKVIHTKNMDNLRALDIATASNNTEIVKILGKYRPDRVDTLTDYLKSRIPRWRLQLINLKRMTEILSNLNQTRDALLVVFALVATAIYQVALSPPGGIWQGQLDSNSPIPSLFHDVVHTIGAPPPATLGKIIMDTKSFFILYFINTMSIFLALTYMVILFPSGLRVLVAVPLLLLSASYTVSMQLIYPNGGSASRHWAKWQVAYSLWFWLLVAVVVCLIVTLVRERKRKKLQREWGTTHIN